MKLFKIFKVKTRKAGKGQTIKPIPKKNEPLKRDLSVHNFEVGHLIKERTEQSVKGSVGATIKSRHRVGAALRKINSQLGQTTKTPKYLSPFGKTRKSP